MEHTVREVTLKNGAKGLVIQAPGVKVVRILVEFHAGFDFADRVKYELPHVMEHMMFTNQSYPKPRQFSREVEKNGAFNNAYTNSSSLEYDYECAAFEVERIADLVQIQLTEPTFPEAELKTELGNVAEELNSNISNPGAVASDNLHVAATGVPSNLSRRNQLSTIRSEDLRRWYRKTHTAKNMRFIVAGDVDFDRLVLPSLNVMLPAGKRLKQPHVKDYHIIEPVLEVRDIPQIYYSIFSCLDSRVSYRESISARIIVNVLANGFSSTLLGKAREMGLIYGLNMGVSTSVHDAVWYMGGAVSPDHTADFFKLVRAEISKARTSKTSKRQFEATKQLMRGQRARGYQRLGDLVNYYDAFFTVGYEEFEEYNRLLDEITHDEAVAAFNRLFAENTWGISFVGSVDEQAAQNYRQLVSPLWDNL